MDFCQTEHFEQILKLQGLITVGTAHIFPNHVTHKEELAKDFELIFNTCGQASLDQIKEYVKTSNQNSAMLVALKPP